MRTGSLKLSTSSVGNSSLKRTKRKAPSPPSKTSLPQSDENSHMTGNVPFLISLTFALFFNIDSKSDIGSKSCHFINNKTNVGF